MDLKSAHKHFSTYCFKKAWELIEKQDRTPNEENELILLNQASLWHWTQRNDCTDINLFIGYLQA